MSDIECTLCGKNKDEDYGVSFFGDRNNFECYDCHVGDCGVCEKPVKGGSESSKVHDCAHCTRSMHESCVIEFGGNEVCKKHIY